MRVGEGPGGTAAGGRGSPLRLARPRRGQVLHGLVLLLVWSCVAAAATLGFLVTSSTTTVVAGHDTVLRPDLSGQVVLRTGPVLPDLRLPSGGPLGVGLDLGKTQAASTEQLIARYAFIASQPEGQIAKVGREVRDLAVEAAVRGAAAGLVPILVWLLIGRARRAELLRRARSWRGAVAGLLAAGVCLLLWQPWWNGDRTLDDEGAWVPFEEFAGVPVDLPPEAAALEVRTDVTTSQSQRLVLSAVDTYERSKSFYADAVAAAGELELREPEEGETVALLVADRHDNIGMDQVARAVADAAGATAVLTAGDDTSTGRPWEAFSLDSLDQAFADLDRYAVSGNHDAGDFVRGYLVDRGWTNPDGEVVDGPGGSVLLGADDPRSSGLGNWRDETGLSFGEHADRIADAACASRERVSTLLVHDANSGREALARGCVDLVVGGHLHVQQGPTKVAGSNGQVGYRYINGTTGGAAYAIAVGSKPRRPAGISLVTYREGRPAGVQAVTLQSTGDFVVDEYVELDLADVEPAADRGPDPEPRPGRGARGATSAEPRA